MATPALTDAQIAEAVAASRAHATKLEAAASLKLSEGSFYNRLRQAAARGLMLDAAPAMPGFRIASVSTAPDGKQHVTQRPDAGEKFEMPAGHVVKGVSALVDPDGRELAKWIKTREGTASIEDTVEYLKTAFVDVKPTKPVKLNKTPPKADLLTLLPCNDWHVGMFAWGKEVGENWDLKIAEETIGRAIEDTVARTQSSGECIVLGGGDLLHADNKENQTAKSGNTLDVDGRYQKVLMAASRLMVRTVDACLRHHGHVTVRILPGNHDEHSAVAVAYFLLAWYRDEPRVTVDVDPSLFFWFRFGAVLLGATHGHTVKIAQMPGIMAHRRAADWGATKFRYVHGFHLHHSAKIATEGNGVVAEVHQAPIPQDAWHFGSGFLSGRSLQAITYHAEFGEISRSRTAILDAKEAA